MHWATAGGKFAPFQGLAVVHPAGEPEQQKGQALAAPEQQKLGIRVHPVHPGRGYALFQGRPGAGIGLGQAVGLGKHHPKALKPPTAHGLIRKPRQAPVRSGPSQRLLKPGAAGPQGDDLVGILQAIHFPGRGVGLIEQRAGQQPPDPASAQPFPQQILYNALQTGRAGGIILFHGL